MSSDVLQPAQSEQNWYRFCCICYWLGACAIWQGGWGMPKRKIDSRSTLNYFAIPCVFKLVLFCTCCQSR